MGIPSKEKWVPCHTPLFCR